MKRIFTVTLLLLSLITYSQISPAIPGNGVIVSPTVVSATTSYSVSQLTTNNTLTVNYGVDFTLNGNMGPGTNKLILLGNNKVIINGTINSNVYIEMNGDVCIYVTGTVNASSGYVTANGTNNFITAGNINNISNITTAVCASTSNTNPCSNTATIACNNLCSSDQNNVATWTTGNNGTNWYNGQNSSSMSATKRAIIGANYTANTSFACCSLVINQGYTLTINSGVVVTVNNNVTNNGNIIIQDGGSLVQVNDAAPNTGNSITVKRATSALKQYDYTYWSSPVVGTTLSTIANGGEAVFYSFDTSIDNWTYLNSSTIMTAGKGYISRAPENLSYGNNATPSYTTTFSGKQNSGIIKLNIVKSGTSYNNLVGNPYPSPLDAKLFIQANSSVISGTIYFWTHKTAISANNSGNQVLNYTADDYAKYNLTGGVGTGTSPTSAPTSIPLRPTGYIASGQAFFVEATTNGTTQLLFNNSMRNTGSANNTQFFRPAAANSIQSADAGAAEEGRIWLNISNTEGAYSEMLLGYVNGATNTIDNLYDGATMDAGNYVSLYSIAETKPFAIQGRGLPFNDADVIPLGFNTTITGSFSVTMNDFDGFFDNQEVYLYDNVNNTITNLHDGPYTFNSEAGTFNDRFELRFTTATLGTETPVLGKNDIGIIRNGNQIRIKSNQQNIASVMVYDLLGRVIFEKNNIDSTDFATNDLSAQNQVVVVKIKTDNNLEMVQKVIMN